MNSILDICIDFFSFHLAIVLSYWVNICNVQGRCHSYAWPEWTQVCCLYKIHTELSFFGEFLLIFLIRHIYHITVADTALSQSSWMLTASRFMEWIGLVSYTYTHHHTPLNCPSVFFLVMLPWVLTFSDNFTSCMSSLTLSDAILFI